MAEEGAVKRGSDEARAWANILSRKFGEAVHFYRNRLELSAVQLSARTKEIGYPITRGTIAKIEGNHRNGKMDVAEVLTLAAALEVAPVDLIFPGFPSYGTHMTPKFVTTAAEAGLWLSGDSDYQPFGRAKAPRAELSQAMREKMERICDGLERAEAKLQLDKWGIPSPHITREEAQAILVDLAVAKADLERMGGSFAGTSWEHHLRDMIENPDTDWAPF